MSPYHSAKNTQMEVIESSAKLFRTNFKRKEGNSLHVTVLTMSHV